MSTLTKSMTIPDHIAIIMDGNGRWATAQNKPRLEGHKAGAKTVRQIVTHCCKIGVKYLTLYAFSTQNFARPPEEVSGLMQLLIDYVKGEWNTIMENGIRLTTIGDTERLPLLTRTALNSLITASAANKGMTLALALAYGGREEITRAVQDIARQVASGQLSPAAITPEIISQNLYTARMPDPDLIIRTSGEQRISNFLLWQLAYSELYITKKLWPEFTTDDLMEAIADYNKRQRRFGLTEAQVTTN